MKCWLKKVGSHWKYHTSIWQAHAWRQVDEGYAVADDFGDLAAVARPQQRAIGVTDDFGVLVEVPA